MAAPAGSAEQLSMLPAVVAPLGGEDAEVKFVGSRKCKMCHKELYKSWEETTHAAESMESLKPGTKAEAKKKAGLDPEKDYTTDEKCLGCHVTGFGKEGGYSVPDAADEKAVKKAAKLANVGCECCHGAGGEYTKLHKEIMKSKRMYKVEEMHKAGTKKIEAATCTACHNEKSPTYQKFDFEEKKNKNTHENFPLKQREG